MYLHVNDFDYDSLITKLVEMYDLGDTPVTSEFIAKAFTDLAAKFKKHKRGQLTPESIALVEAFLSFNTGWDEFQEGDTAKEFWESRAESIDNSLSGLFDCLVDPDTEIPENLERIIQSISEITEIDVHNADPEEASELISMIDELVEQYTPIDFNETELWILSQMAGFDKFLSGIRDITVMPVPGKVVKCMDTLITFPIILIEVLGNE